MKQDSRPRHLRRDFLKISLGALATAAMNTRAASSEKSEHEQVVHVLPERLRHDSATIYGIGTRQIAALENDDRKTELGIRQYLNSLETYTNLSLIIPEEASEKGCAKIQAILKDLALTARTRILRAREDVLPWVQDGGVSALTARGRHVFVVSGTPGRYSDRSERVPDEQVLATKLFGSTNVIRAPFSFDGGNIAFDTLPDGSRCVFVGESILSRDQEDMKLIVNADHHLAPDPEYRKQLILRISRFFDGARVIPLGLADEAQNSLAYHRDFSHVQLTNALHVVAQCDRTTLRDYVSKQIASDEVQDCKLFSRTIPKPVLDYTSGWSQGSTHCMSNILANMNITLSGQLSMTA